VDDALAQLADQESLRRLLDQWTPDELTDLIERMNTAIEELPVAEDIDADPARRATPLLLNLLPQLPEDRGAITSRGSMLLMRATLRLLRRIPDENVRGEVVRAVFAETSTLSGRLILLWTVGHREHVGLGLVKPAVATDLEDRLRDELAALPPGDFAG
jgi:hypothetical protein